MSLLSRKKNVVICNFPRFSGEIWLPYFWSSAKTYYEKHGQRISEWNWIPCYTDVYSSEHKEEIKKLLLKAQPDVFAISLYVWNYTISYEIAEWVRATWPECIIISGGPHQYFKHDLNWFKEHPYLDASHHGDCYGELCLTQILDNYDNNTKTVNWNLVSDVEYPTKGRNIKSSKLSLSHQDKKKFDYDWGPLYSQFEFLQDFIKYQHDKFPGSMLLCVLETTRGCPYGCTYCDWGGGTATTVIKKSLDTVKLDIDAASQFNLTFLYMADANFGIFGERDISIIKYLVKRKKETGQMFKIGYGGFAKTENRLDAIKEILRVDIDNELSLTKELKLSLQSLDQQVLDNIDRQNVGLEQQLAVFEPLARDKQMPLYVEMIMGLPGINLDKYYYELDVLGSHDLSVQWFEWILLPETPAFAHGYRNKYGIQTITKKKGWAVKEEDSRREVVVGGNEFTSRDYMQMLLSNSLYHLIIQGGFFKDSINWIVTNGTKHGKLVRDIYENFFLNSEYAKQVQERWHQICTNEDIWCNFEVDNQQIYGGWYFVALAYLKPDFVTTLINWLQDKYFVPSNLVESDTELNISINNYSTKKYRKWYVYDYRKFGGFQSNSIQSIIGLFINHVDTGYVFRGRKTVLGIYSVKN
jgi:hypothetical protein